MVKALTVFDLDQTLFLGNSSYHFGVYLYRTGKLSLLRMLYLVGCFFCHKLGWLSFYQLHHLTIKAFFQSIPFSQVEGWAEEFLNLQFDQLINPQIHDRLLQSKQANHITAILSTSPHFLVKGIAKRFNVDHFLGTAYHVENDQIHHVSSLVLGADKAKFVEEFAKKEGIPLQYCTAYSDHMSDLALLQAVGNPVAVKPKKELRKICLENKWTILD